MVDVREADLVLAALLDVLHLQESVVGPPLGLSETRIDAVIHVINSVSCALPRLLLSEAGLVNLLESRILLQQCRLTPLSE